MENRYTIALALVAAFCCILDFFHLSRDDLESYALESSSPGKPPVDHDLRSTDPDDHVTNPKIKNYCSK